MTEIINGIPQPVNVAEKNIKATWFDTAGSGITSGTITKPAGNGPDVVFVLDEWGTDTDALVSILSNGKPTWETPVDSGGNNITTTFNTAGEYAFSGTPSPAGDHAVIFVYTCYLKNFNSDESIFESELVPAQPGSDHDIADHADTTATGTELETLTDGSDAGGLHIHDARYYTETELSATTAGGASGAEKIGIPIIAGATYTNVREYINLFGSAGRATGGVISDIGGEVVRVALGTGFIKATDDDTAELLSFDWAQADKAIPTDTTRFLGVVYGTPPVVDVRTADTYDLDTEFSLGSVVNVGGTLHILQNPWWVTDGITNIIERFRGQGHLIRDNHIGGLVPGVTATRRLTVSGGTLWGLLNEFPITQFTSVGDADTFEAYYLDDQGDWYDDDLYQYRVDKWNDITQTGAAALANLANNKYCNLWIYVEADDDEIAIVYGQAQFVSAAGAEAEAPPTNLSAHHVEHSVLIGRIIIKQGVDAPVQVQSVWETQFTAAQASDHENLAGLLGGTAAEHYHLTSARHTALVGGSSDAGSLHNHKAEAIKWAVVFGGM